MTALPPVAASVLGPLFAKALAADLAMPDIVAQDIAPTPPVEPPAAAAAPAPPASALATAVSQAAAGQASLAPLLADLGVAVASPQTPPAVQAAISTVLASALPVDPPPAAEDLRQALQQSGVFLEANLAAGQAPAPGDLKAALLVLTQTLEAWSSASPSTAAPSQASPTNPPASVEAVPATGDPAAVSTSPTAVAPPTSASAPATIAAAPPGEPPSANEPAPATAPRAQPATPPAAAEQPMLVATQPAPPPAAPATEPLVGQPPAAPEAAPSPAPGAPSPPATVPAAPPSSGEDQSPASVHAGSGSSGVAVSGLQPTPAKSAEVPAAPSPPDPALSTATAEPPPAASPIAAPPEPPGPATAPPDAGAAKDTLSAPVTAAPSDDPPPAAAASPPPPSPSAPPPTPGAAPPSGDATNLLLGLAQALQADAEPAPVPRPAPPARPPPPVAGGAIRGQPAASPSLASDAPAAQIANRLLAQVAAALDRHTLMQAGSMGPAAADETRPQSSAQWLFEIPLLTPQGTAIAPFEIERDGAGTGQGGGEPVWRARFSLDLEPMGPVHARVSLHGGAVRVALWAESPETLQRLAGGQDELTAALSDDGFVPKVQIHPGAPAPPRPAAPGRFTDTAA